MPIGKLWIYCLLYVCTDTDFSAEDKISVTFCSAVHRRPKQGMTHFCELCCTKPKIGRIGRRAGHANPDVNVTVEIPNGNNVKATFDFVERNVRLVAFDSVASTLFLMWMGALIFWFLMTLRDKES